MKKLQQTIKRSLVYSFSFLFALAALVPVYAAGEIDSGFRTAVQDTSLGYVSAIVPQPDGKILIGGNFTVAANSGRSNVARLNADGTIDPTFIPPDFYKDFVGTTSLKLAVIYAVAYQTDGKVIVGGDFSRIGSEFKSGVVRLNQDGSLDNTFNVLFADFSPLNPQYTPKVYDIKIQPDNKILLGGNFRNRQDGIERLGITRVNPNGSLDASFSMQDIADVRSIILQGDGKIIYSGLNGSISYLRRVTPNGLTDNDFLDGVFSGTIFSLALQADGKILVGGSFSTTATATRSLIRLNANGAIDPAFNGSGVGVDFEVRDVAVLPDGKIIIAGSFYYYNNTIRTKVARINTDGTLDTGFNYSSTNSTVNFAIAVTNDGGFIIGGTNSDLREKLQKFNSAGGLDANFKGDVYQSSAVYQVKVQPDGKVLVGGTFNKLNGVARRNFGRLNADGETDAAFVSNVIGTVASIALQPDGKIIIGGAITQVNGTAVVRIARLNSDGTQDLTFQQPLSSGSLEKVLVLPDGKILIAGYFYLSGNASTVVTIARLNPNGSPDTTFNQVPVNTPGLIRAMAVQPDGKIVVGGDFTQIAGANRNRIARLNADGTLDTGFSPVGGASASVYDLAVQSDGKIVIGGVFLAVNGVSNKFRLARLNTDGSLDTAYNPGFNAPIYAVERQADDKILVGGGFTPYSGGIERIRIARLLADGTVDPTFNGNGANETVRDITIQTDGKILIGGEFSRINNYTTVGAARLFGNISSKTPFDFDGDGRADVAVFRASTGYWYTSQNPALNYGAFLFGQAGDKLVPADYDGDGKTDVAVVRGGNWYMQRSSLGFSGTLFGDAGDIPVPADYDGDGKADIAVFRPSNGMWYLQQSTAGFSAVALGLGTDKPVPGDYNGDGKAEVAVFRPSNGTWYLSTNPATGYGAVPFGQAEDKPVPADYDGDGKTDIAVFRPSSGTWYLLQSTAGFTGLAFGLGTDLPTAADYDGDGRADIAVFRNGNWYLNRSTQGFTGIAFGVSTDSPIPNSFVR